MLNISKISIEVTFCFTKIVSKSLAPVNKIKEGLTLKKPEYLVMFKLELSYSDVWHGKMENEAGGFPNV